jgi:hypothetical protein
MAVSALAPATQVPVGRLQRPFALWVKALAGAAAAAASFVITSDIDEQAPLADAALVARIMLAYLLCGLIAWSRRPQSTFGPLMVVAGFAPLLSRLSELDATLDASGHP